jgi:FAD/FMN-containing dehydrogenase
MSVRLAKKTSNLFRQRGAAHGPGLDVSGLAGVISIDARARSADVQGMCTYEDLVAETLKFGLIPYVVPQLKTITLGGAVTGLGIESTSFRNGLPHESVLEMDVFTGTGEVVTCSPSAHDDLYRTFPNSYGSLGYATRLRRTPRCATSGSTRPTSSSRRSLRSLRAVNGRANMSTRSTGLRSSPGSTT